MEYDFDDLNLFLSHQEDEVEDLTALRVHCT